MADGADTERTQQVVKACSAVEEHSFWNLEGKLCGSLSKSR